MKPAYLRGLGLWSPGFASPEAWCRGEPDPEVSTADARMLEGPLRRRASPLTRISVDVFDQATLAAGIDAAAIPTIWATAHGEHGNAIKLLKMMLRGDGKLSPTHFHNSVHNTPSAYASIAGGNASPSTTLTGGPELVASSILEALCHLDAGAPEIAVIVADEPLHEPFAQPDMQAPLALGFCFSSKPDGALAMLCDLRRETLPAIKPHDRLGGLYISAGLPLLEHAVARKPSTIPLEIEDHWRRKEATREPVWCIDLEPLDAA
jgi:Beta-ketoacyl synthase, N-terminal domain